MHAVAPHDLPFRQSLFALPALSAHKPDPRPDPPDRIAAHHRHDIDHWARHGIGRWCVWHQGHRIGFCGLTCRAGEVGLNLSYHLRPDDWGQGHATRLVKGMQSLAQGARLTGGPLYRLVRPANPASARVLEKAGFQPVETRILGGAPTVRWDDQID